MKYLLTVFFFTFYGISNAGVVEKCFDELCFRQSVTNTAHKYYLSVSNIKYNPKAGALQMTSRFFIDDLEDAISIRAEKKIVLTKKGSIEKNKDLISDYFKAKLSVKIEDQQIVVNYLGAEVENDQLVLYIEIPVDKPPTQLEMKFTALMEIFEDQKNMVHFKINGKRKTLLMNVNKKEDAVKF